MNTRFWIEYFEANRGRVREPTLTPHGSTLAEKTRVPLARSLAVFQLGESGGGTRLMRYARAVAVDEKQLAGYERAVALFVAEEQRHAALLAELVRHLGGGLLEKQWSNSVFRRIRHGLGLAFNIQMLLIAELMAEVYYGVLYRRSGDAAVRACCHRILKDEMGHLAFHGEFFRERLARLSMRKRALWRLQFSLCLQAVACVVAWEHRGCFRALGMPPVEVTRLAYKAGGRFLRRVNDGWRLWRVKAGQCAMGG